MSFVFDLNTPLCSSDPSQDVLCISLNFFNVACYMLIFGASAALLANKFSKERERKWQLLFHGFIMASCLMRSLYFVLGALQNLVSFETENVFLDSVPAFLFFSSYFVLLFFWAELYHNNTGRLAHFRPHYIMLNVVMYASLLALLLMDLLLYCPFDRDCADGRHTPVEIALHSLTAAIFLVLAFCYALYGYRLYNKFALLPTISSQRHEAHRRVVIMLAIITMLFTFFFVMRTAMVVLWIVVDMSRHVWFDPVYYFFFEIVPITLLFYVFYRTAAKGSTPKTEPNRVSETSTLINSSGRESQRYSGRE